MKRDATSKDFLQTLIRSKRRLLEMHFDSKVGHLGSNLSCFDALMVLFHFFLTKEDRFILSKGHAAGSLYTVLWSMGKISDSELKTFCMDDSKFPGHPSGTGIPDLFFPTGSLGHGPSLSSGLALAAKHSCSKRRIFCLCSDGEWQEGSCWEALIFAVHHNLKNLTILIDQNKLQGFGATQEVVSFGDLSQRLAAFGPAVLACNGHDHKAVFDTLDAPTDRPKIVLLNTIKGRGTLFENKIESHYLPLTLENFEFSLAQTQKQEKI